MRSNDGIVVGGDVASSLCELATSPPTKQHTTVSKFVSTFKRFCNKEYGENIWQRSYYDHVIRDREDYEEHVRYIMENPARWYYDELYTTE